MTIIIGHYVCRLDLNLCVSPVFCEKLAAGAAVWGFGPGGVKED
ncbi:MAG: hypothetical protein R6W95_10860 [Desulfosarcina sp.]